MALSKNEMALSHPDLNALAAFIDGRLSEADHSGVLAHLGDCFECRAIVAAQARGLGGASVQGAQPAGRRSRWGFRPAVWLPIAAALTLATTAGLVMLRIDRLALPPESPVPSTSEPAPPKTATPPAVAPPAGVPAPSRTVTPPPAPPESLATRRSAVRVVNGKTFRLVAGEWIDSAYDPVALLPVQDIAGTDARKDLLERMPALAPYATLGPRVTVAHEGVVYRFR